MPFTGTQIVGGLVVPALLVAVIALLLWKLHPTARCVLGLAAAAGFGIAFWNLETKPGWPPSANVLYLLFYFGMAAGVLSFVDSLFRPPIWVRTVVLIIFWRLAVRMLLAPQIPRSISPNDAEMWIDVSTLVTLLWWFAFESLAQTEPAMTAPLILGGISAAAAIVMALGWHILSSGAMAGSLAFVCLMVVILEAIGRRITFSHGLSEAIVLMLQLLLVHAYFYTDDNLTGAQQGWIAILLATPLLALVGDLPTIKKRSGLVRLAIRAIPVVIAVGVVCAVTITGYLHNAQSSSQQMDE